MATPWPLIMIFLGVAVLYVLLPVGLDAFRRFRERRVVSCPEAGRDAEVGLNAARAALGSVVAQRRILSIQECSLWPEREGCAQRCLSALAEEGLPVRSLPGRA